MGSILTGSWLTDILTLFLIIFSITYYIITKDYNYWAKKGIPHIKPAFPVGNFWPALKMTRSCGQVFQDIYNSTTERFIGFYIFQRPFLLIRDPDLIKSVLVRDFTHFADKCHANNPDFDELGINNLFNIKTPHWKPMRSKLTPMFSALKLKTLFPLLRDVGDKLNTHLITHNPTEKINVKELTSRFSIDVISSVAFGVETNSFLGKTTDFLEAAATITKFTVRRSIELTSFFFIPFFVRLFKFSFFGEEATQMCRQVFNDAVKYRDETGFQRNDLIDVLMKIRDDEIKRREENESGEIRLEGDTLVAQTAIFFAAGYETVSSSISFCLYKFSENAEWQTKARQEIADCLAETNGEITYEALDKMKFLGMIITEALRLFPPLPFIDRECTKDYVIPNTNITIEKGTAIVLSSYGLHRDPKIYPNPDEFDPYRWSEENEQNIVPYTFLAFGEGPRNCIGKRLGIIEVKVALVSIIKDFEILPTENRIDINHLDPKAMVTSPKTQIDLIIQPLNKSKNSVS